MPKRLYNFVDPVFNEWMFDFLLNLSLEEKSRLNATETHLIRNRKAVQEFVSKGNLEKKLTILTKLDVEWHFVFSKRGKFTAQLIKDVYTQYTVKGKRLEIIEKLFKDKTFVFSSKDVALSLAMMNQNVHTTGYIVNPNFLKFRAGMQNLKNFGDIKVRESKEMQASLKMFANLFFAFNTSDGMMESDYQLMPMDVAILCLLYVEPNNYVRMDYIRAQLQHQYKPLSIGIRCAYLWKQRNMIDKMPSREREPSYKIMQAGILALGHLFNRMVNLSINR